MAEPRGGGKTLAIQLTDDQHAQLFLIGQVENANMKTLLIWAVEAFIEAKRTGPDFAARAQTVLEDIDREAAARRQAIQTLFGPAGTPEGDTPAPAEPAEAPTRRSSRRGGEPTP